MTRALSEQHELELLGHPGKIGGREDAAVGSKGAGDEVHALFVDARRRKVA
jgi:hypothetical protein